MVERGDLYERHRIGLAFTEIRFGLGVETDCPAFAQIAQSGAGVAHRLKHGDPTRKFDHRQR